MCKRMKFDLCFRMYVQEKKEIKKYGLIAIDRKREQENKIKKRR